MADERESTRRLRNTVIGSVVVFSLLGVATVLMALYVLLQPPAAPYAYGEHVYPADKPLLCPGEVLIFHPTIHVRRVPVTVGLTHTIWDVKAGHTAVFGTEMQYSIQTRVGAIPRTLTIQVPDLPPGDYELRESAQDTDSPPSVTSIFFTVPPACPVPVEPAPPGVGPVQIPTPQSDTRSETP